MFIARPQFRATPATSRAYRPPTFTCSRRTTMNAPDALISAAAGMRAQAARLDLIAADLANAGTPGYRSPVPEGERFSERLGAAGSASTAQGALRSTGVSTDLALSGPGYFAVATFDGVRYTRDGRFTSDSNGTLVDARAHRVVGMLGAGG